MSREIEIDGKKVKFVTLRDIAPGGLDELRELMKTAEPSKTSFWHTVVRDVPETEAQR
jgi:hypothetical protein